MIFRHIAHSVQTAKREIDRPLKLIFQKRRTAGWLGFLRGVDVLLVDDAVAAAITIVVVVCVVCSFTVTLITVHHECLIVAWPPCPK